MRIAAPASIGARTLLIVLLLLLIVLCGLPFGSSAHDSADHGFSLSDVLARYVVLLALAPVASRLVTMFFETSVSHVERTVELTVPYSTHSVALEAPPILI